MPLASPELRGLVKAVKETTSDSQAIALIKDEWTKWQPNIDRRALTGKPAKPPIASRLRQGLGIVFAHDVTEFVELNPAMAVDHLNKVRSAVEILQQVASMQEGRIARAAQ